MSVFSNIVCCINLSENPDDVAQYAYDIAKQNGAKLILVHVARTPESPAQLFASGSTVSEAIQESRKKYEKDFVEYVRRHFADVEKIYVLAYGRVDEEIMRVTDQHCADLIIVGSMSTKGFLGSFFNNRESEGVIGKSRVPVLVIPNDLSLECAPAL